jgi:hypothetical protein
MTDEKVVGLADVYDEVRTVGREVRDLGSDLRAADADRRTDIATLTVRVGELEKSDEQLWKLRDRDEMSAKRTFRAAVAGIATGVGFPILLNVLHLSGKG